MRSAMRETCRVQEIKIIKKSPKNHGKFHRKFVCTCSGAGDSLRPTVTLRPWWRKCVGERAVLARRRGASARVSLGEGARASAERRGNGREGFRRAKALLGLGLAHPGQALLEGGLEPGGGTREWMETSIWSQIVT